MDWRISIPTQGVEIVTSDKSVIKGYFADEVAYYNRLALIDYQLQFGQTGYGTLNLTRKATEQLSKIIADIDSENTAALNAYVSAANARRVLVGKSRTGERVDELRQISAPGAFMLAAIFSSEWLEWSHPQGRDFVAIFRSVAFGNPANFAFDDLISAQKSQAEASEAQKRSAEAEKKLTSFVDEKTRLISDLENLYRRQLTVREPAVSWTNVARRKTVTWTCWLVLFSMMVIGPIYLALINWATVSAALVQITAPASANGGISLSGLAAISVPALFYAWLLKNISRVFIQNLNLADDAHHRRSLALTYMGLLQDEKRPATDQDRAIILNALFRPIPPQSADQGPPAGLLDLIRSKG